MNRPNCTACKLPLVIIGGKWGCPDPQCENFQPEQADTPQIIGEPPASLGEVKAAAMELLIPFEDTAVVLSRPEPDGVAVGRVTGWPAGSFKTAAMQDETVVVMTVAELDALKRAITRKCSGVAAAEADRISAMIAGVTKGNTFHLQVARDTAVRIAGLITAMELP